MKTVNDMRLIDVKRLNKAYDLLLLALHHYDKKGNDIALQIRGNGSVASNIACALASLDTIFQEFGTNEGTEADRLGKAFASLNDTFTTD